jgi:phosphate transport system substrate-binding protein
VRGFCAALAIGAICLVAACGGPRAAPPGATSASSPSQRSPSPQVLVSRTPASGAGPVCVPGTITVAGSTAIAPLTAAAAKEYEGSCPGSTVDVQLGGSIIGLSQAASGAVEIGASDVRAEESGVSGLTDHVVARQGFAIVTSKDVTITNLTQQQATDVFTCKVTNWKDVGGPDKPILVVLRPPVSGTRTIFRNLALNGAPECQTASTLTQDSNGTVRDAVEQTAGAVSVIGFAYFADPSTLEHLNIVKYEGVEASVANISNGTYKIASDANLYTKGDASGLTKAFLDFMLSPEVQTGVVPSLNFGAVR